MVWKKFYHLTSHIGGTFLNLNFDIQGKKNVSGSSWLADLSL